jgi:hypothetical protein
MALPLWEANPSAEVVAQSEAFFFVRVDFVAAFCGDVLQPEERSQRTIQVGTTAFALIEPYSIANGMKVATARALLHLSEGQSALFPLHRQNHPINQIL